MEFPQGYAAMGLAARSDLHDATEEEYVGGNEVWIEKGKGRTVQVKIRLFTDKIADGGQGYVRPGQAWFKGDVSFIPNTAHGIGSIGSDPIMFNRPEEVVDAI
jgi:hypothetical protein